MHAELRWSSAARTFLEAEIPMRLARGRWLAFWGQSGQDRDHARICAAAALPGPQPPAPGRRAGLRDVLCLPTPAFSFAFSYGTVRRDCGGSDRTTGAVEVQAPRLSPNYCGTQLNPEQRRLAQIVGRGGPGNRGRHWV